MIVERFGNKDPRQRLWRGVCDDCGSLLVAPREELLSKPENSNRATYNHAEPVVLTANCVVCGDASVYFRAPKTDKKVQ